MPNPLSPHQIKAKIAAHYREHLPIGTSEISRSIIRRCS